MPGPVFEPAPRCREPGYGWGMTACGRAGGFTSSWSYGSSSLLSGGGRRAAARNAGAGCPRIGAQDRQRGARCRASAIRTAKCCRGAGHRAYLVAGAVRRPVSAGESLLKGLRRGDRRPNARQVNLHFPALHYHRPAVFRLVHMGFSGAETIRMSDDFSSPTARTSPTPDEHGPRCLTATVFASIRSDAGAADDFTNQRAVNNYDPKHGPSARLSRRPRHTCR